MTNGSGDKPREGHSLTRRLLSKNCRGTPSGKPLTAGIFRPPTTTVVITDRSHLAIRRPPFPLASCFYSIDSPDHFDTSQRSFNSRQSRYGLVVVPIATTGHRILWISALESGRPAIGRRLVISDGSFLNPLDTQHFERSRCERLTHLGERFGAAQVMVPGVRSPTLPKGRFRG